MTLKLSKEQEEYLKENQSRIFDSILYPIDAKVSIWDAHKSEQTINTGRLLSRDVFRKKGCRTDISVSYRQVIELDTPDNVIISVLMDEIGMKVHQIQRHANGRIYNLALELLTAEQRILFKDRIKSMLNVSTYKDVRIITEYKLSTRVSHKYVVDVLNCLHRTHWRG